MSPLMINSVCEGRVANRYVIGDKPEAEKVREGKKGIGTTTARYCFLVQYA
jgi:hypothetical protein